MNIIEFRPLQKLKDDVLIEEIDKKMNSIKYLSETLNFNEYWEEAMLLNEMIKEAKRRDISIDKKRLAEKILFF